MSIVGIDFGNTSLLIAQAAKGGVDVILNDASNRQTATSMSFQGKQRFFGDAASAMARSNVKNTISLMKLLVGRRYEDPAVQAELANAPFQHARCQDGGVGVVVNYNDQDTVIPAEHVMAMMLSLAKITATKANNNVGIADAVLAVPCWYTDAQRRGILAACQIVNLNCLKIVKETTAIALSFGIYKSAKGLFSETEPVHVMFIDIGYTCYSVVIADFVQEKLVIRSTSWNQSVSGRDFDNVIVEFLAEQFEKKTGINVRRNKKAMLKLEAAAEKAKKTLSPMGVTEANISVECLAEDRDLNCVLSLEEFERRAAPLIAKLPGPVMSALAEAGLTREQLSDVEIVGGSSRVQCIKRTLGSVLGLDPSALNFGLKTTMNSDEAVARGSVLQCAMLSSRVKVKPFNIVDRVEYPIEVSYESAGSVAAAEVAADDNDAADAAPAATSSGGVDTVLIFERGFELPHKPRRLTFKNKSTPFDVTVQYAASAIADGHGNSHIQLPQGTDRVLGKFRINIPEKYRSTPNGEGNDVRVTFGLDRSGNVNVISAHLMEEVVSADVPPPPAEGEGKAEEPVSNKKKFHKVDLEVVASECFGLSASSIRTCIDTEAVMQAADNLIRETADKRNELESFIYSMRDKLDNSLKNYCTNSEKQQLTVAMEAAEEWLYGDGFESTKAEYIKKIDALKGPASLIEFRLAEETNRPLACEALKNQIAIVRAFAANTDKDHEHITTEERSGLRNEADKAESWLYDMLGRQADLSQYNDPVLTGESIGHKRQELVNATRTTMSKPKPKAAPAPAKEEPTYPTAAAPDGEKSESAAKEEAPSELPAEEKMETTD